MGGSDSGYAPIDIGLNPQFETLSLNSNDIGEYAARNPNEANLLKSFGNKIYRKDGRIFGGSITNDITDIYRSFSEYLQRRDQANQERAEYIQKKSEQPGRSATLLTPYSSPEAKTLLGSQSNPSRTLLG